MCIATKSHSRREQRKDREILSNHRQAEWETNKKTKINVILKISCDLCLYACIVTHIARVWIYRVGLPILLVVRPTGKMNISLPAFVPENLVSRDRFGSPVPRQPAHLHTQAESGAYLRDSSRVPRRRPFIYLKTPYAIYWSFSSLPSHAIIAYRWRSLPRVRRHRASKPQGSSEVVLPWQVTMDQSICASLSHTVYLTI